MELRGRVLAPLMLIGWTLACTGGSADGPSDTECHSDGGYSVVVAVKDGQDLPDIMIKEGDENCDWGGDKIELLKKKSYRDMGGGFLVTSDAPDGEYGSNIEIWSLQKGKLQSSHPRVSTGHADKAYIDGDEVVIGGYDIGLSNCGKKKAKRPAMCPEVFQKCWSGFKTKGASKMGFDVSKATKLACNHDPGVCDVDVTATVHVLLDSDKRKVVGGGTCRLVP